MSVQEVVIESIHSETFHLVICNMFRESTQLEGIEDQVTLSILIAANYHYLPWTEPHNLKNIILKALLLMADKAF